MKLASVSIVYWKSIRSKMSQIYILQRCKNVTLYYSKVLYSINNGPLVSETETTRQLSGGFVANVCVLCVFWSLLSSRAQLSGVLFSLISPVLFQTFLITPQINCAGSFCSRFWGCSQRMVGITRIHTRNLESYQWKDCVEFGEFWNLVKSF